MESTEYSYSWAQRAFSFLLTLMFTGISIFLISVSIISLIRWIIGNGPTNIIVGSIALAAMAIIVGFMTATFANLKPNIRVSDRGLEVQIFLVWWYSIPWQHVRDIRTIPFIGFSRVRLVIVHKLTPIHWVIGTIYFAFFQPAFLIGSEIDNYDRLIHLIKKKIGKELWE